MFKLIFIGFALLFTCESFIIGFHTRENFKFIKIIGNSHIQIGEKICTKSLKIKDAMDELEKIRWLRSFHLQLSGIFCRNVLVNFKNCLNIHELNIKYDKLFQKGEEFKKRLKLTLLPKTRKFSTGITINKKILNTRPNYFQTLADIIEDLDENVVIPYQKGQDIDTFYMHYINKTLKRMGPLWQAVDERFTNLINISKGLHELNFTSLFTKDEIMALNVRTSLAGLPQFTVWPEILDIYSYYDKKFDTLNAVVVLPIIVLKENLTLKGSSIGKPTFRQKFINAKEKTDFAFTGCEDVRLLVNFFNVDRIMNDFRLRDVLHRSNTDCNKHFIDGK